MKQIDISTPEAVDAFIAQLREEFPTPTRLSLAIISTLYPVCYCVAGAFCKFVGFDDAGTFPSVGAVASVLVEVNPSLMDERFLFEDGQALHFAATTTRALHFAAAIVRKNERREFDLAYDLLRDALNFRTNED